MSLKPPRPLHPSVSAPAASEGLPWTLCSLRPFQVKTPGADGHPRATSDAEPTQPSGDVLPEAEEPRQGDL